MRDFDLRAHVPLIGIPAPGLDARQAATAGATLGHAMNESSDRSGLRARGEDAVGELAQALLENPLFNSALGKALGAGERAASAQRSAMEALNFASVSDVERLEQRLRSLSGRLEDLEDQLDELSSAIVGLRQQVASSASAGATSD